MIIISNTIALSVALLVVIVLILYEMNTLLHLFLTLFIIGTITWGLGIVLQDLSQSMVIEEIVFRLSHGLQQIGFITASISLYGLVTTVTGTLTRSVMYFLLIALAIAGIYIIYSVIVLPVSSFNANQSSINLLGFLTFDVSAIIVAWRYRQSYDSKFLLTGIMLYVLGHAFTFSRELIPLRTLASLLQSGSLIAISLSFFYTHIIFPLRNREAQLESLHDVSIAITRRIATNAILNEIANQAINWVHADASCFVECHSEYLQVVAISNLPDELLLLKVPYENTLAGQSARERRSIIWQKTDNNNTLSDPIFLPLADAIGNVVASPMEYDAEVMGVLIAIGGKQGRTLGSSDIRLLELLCNQAAVALSQDRIFNDQKNLAEALRYANSQLHSVLAGTENPIIAVDRNFNLIFVNTAAQDVFDVSLSHEGLSIYEVFPGSVLPTSYKRLIRDVRKHKVHIYELTHKQKVYLAHIAAIGQSQNFEGLVAVLNDVTELKELDRIKSEMVRMTSHDLKNPLQAAIANLDLLKDDLEPINNTEVSLSISNIEKQLIRMNRIISGILDLERAKLTVMTEVCHPDRIVENVIHELEDIASERSITILVNKLSDYIPDFWGDNKQFERALVNIVENAIKFSADESEITISLRTENNQVIFIVQDDGIGIPEDMHNAVFERFYRGMQSGAEHISGSGLGLSLVKAVVEQHRGKVWIDSQIGQGTKFYVSIPAIIEA